MPVAAVDAPDRYDFWARGVWGEVSDRMVATIGQLGAIPTHGDPGLEAASDAARQSARLYQQLTPFRPKDDRKSIVEPGSLPAWRRPVPTPARRARGDARGRVAAPRRRALGVRRLRHPRQPGARISPTGLKLTADSLLAFQRDLEARGLADRVLVHVWTEFGRRAKENGSGGTDHGAAGTGLPDRVAR